MSAVASTSAAAASAPADTSSLPVVDLDLYLREPSSAAGQAECEKVRALPETRSAYVCELTVSA